jgi:hypothetical protein
MALSAIEGLRYPYPFPCLARDRPVASLTGLRDSLLGILGCLAPGPF